MEQMLSFNQQLIIVAMLTLQQKWVTSYRTIQGFSFVV